MDEILGSILVIGLIMFSFISGPVYDSFNMQDVAINNYIKVVANDFQNEVRKDGYVDSKTYYKLLNDLNATKRMYKIELLHTSRLVYPKGDNDVEVKYIEHGNKDILNTLFKENKKYYLKYGDDFSIKLTEEQEEPSVMIKRAAYSINTSYNYLTFSYGGMVENEDF